MRVTSGGVKVGVSAATGSSPRARVAELQRAALFERNIGELQRRGRSGEGSEALRASGRGEMELRAVLPRRQRRETREAPPEVDEACADAHGVVDRASPVGGGDQHPVGERPPPVLPRLDAFEAEHCAHETSDVAGVAVRIPAGSADDRLSQRKIVGGIENRHDHQGVIGYDVAIARIFVVAVMRLDLASCVAPVRISAPPLPNVGDQPRNRTRAIDLGEADVDQMLDVARQEGLGLHRGPELCGVDGRAVVADPGGLLREPSRKRRIARRRRWPSRR